MKYNYYNSAKKDIEIGTRIKASHIYIRNGRKSGNSENCVRYTRKEFLKECICVGKRVINEQGFTEGDDGWFWFVPVEKRNVHLVAINKQQLAYVRDEDIMYEVEK